MRMSERETMMVWVKAEREREEPTGVVVEKGRVIRGRQVCGVSMRGDVEVSVPWLALRSLAASRTGSKRLDRVGTVAVAGVGGL
jgi:hypothetical protein